MRDHSRSRVPELGRELAGLREDALHEHGAERVTKALFDRDHVGSPLKAARITGHDMAALTPGRILPVPGPPALAQRAVDVEPRAELGQRRAEVGSEVFVAEPPVFDIRTSKRVTRRALYRH